MIPKINNLHPMTVAELIEKLKQFPQDVRLVTLGHEGGLVDMTHVEISEILLNYNTIVNSGENKWTPLDIGGGELGPHEYADDILIKNSENYEKVSAVILSNKPYRIL